MPNVQASAQLRRGSGGAQGDFILFHGQAEGAARCKQVPMGIGELSSLKHSMIEGLNELEEVPGPFTTLESMYICFCEEIWQLGTGLGSLKELMLERCYGLNDLSILTALEQLHIEECDLSLTYIREIAALRELKLSDVTVQNLPDPIRLM
jgi:hypothetical protein